ncbi:hypothetical protein B1H39_23865 [Serratia marcescens]|nr:hypothetical protein B1H39_23865 [Serratia marcescens]
MFVEIAAPAVAGRGILYMAQSLQDGSGQEKGIGASRLTAQACSFYVDVNVAVGLMPPREAWCAQVARR